MPFEIYSKTVIYDDGTIAVIDATNEIKDLKKEVNLLKKGSKPTMTVEEVADFLGWDRKTVLNKMISGFFVEGRDYIKITQKTKLFYKDALLKRLKVAK